MINYETDPSIDDRGLVLISDVEVQNEGSVVLFRLLTPEADAWVEENVAGHPWLRGDAFVVQHNVASAVAQGMIEDGLEVR